MKHTTYELLKRAHLGDVDKKALQKARNEETDPFLQYAIDFAIKNYIRPVSWDSRSFTHDFKSVSPHEKLDETVVTFLLRIASLFKEEIYIRTFRKPESYDALLAWQEILRTCIYCVLTLLYNVTWTAEHFFGMDEMILKLVREGDALTLRRFMKKFGIDLAQDSYPAEEMFARLNFLHVGQFSGFFWRMIHWMAEAIQLRQEEHTAFAKRKWREFVVGPFFRTVRCPLCMIHIYQMVRELKPKLLDASEDFAKLWFDIHNKVHQSRRDMYNINEPDYSESEYKEDIVFMLPALEPK